MKILSIFGKYLDQPKLVEKFSHAVPAILIAGGSLYALNNVLKAPESQRGKQFIKDATVLTGTISAALFAPKLAKKIIKNKHHAHYHGHNHDCHHHIHDGAELIDDFIQNNKITQKTANILNKAKEKVLNFSEVKIIFEELNKTKNGKEFLDEFIPTPENIDSKHIFSEIGKLSIIGIMPVLGGITGGIIGDKLTEKNWKKKIPDKIKEGSYQYLANIFLCNIGAGAALWAMEKANIQSKAARAIAMIGGILLTGLVLGSVMANYIGQKVIDPMLGHKNKKGGLYSERKPEVIDVSLHVDDVATVAVLSGLKWIEPALPILYSISGYRAGIGYRNGEK